LKTSSHQTSMGIKMGFGVHPFWDLPRIYFYKRKISFSEIQLYQIILYIHSLFILPQILYLQFFLQMWKFSILIWQCAFFNDIAKSLQTCCILCHAMLENSCLFISLHVMENVTYTHIHYYDVLLFSKLLCLAGLIRILVLLVSA